MPMPILDGGWSEGSLERNADIFELDIRNIASGSVAFIWNFVIFALFVII